MGRTNLALREEVPPEVVRLEDSPMLPAQFFHHRSRTTLRGERRLLLAVLEEAIDSFCKTCGRLEQRNRNRHREAEDWLFSNDYTWFLSFQNICDVLDLDSSSLRERLVAWRNARGAFDPLAGPAKIYPLTVRPL